MKRTRSLGRRTARACVVPCLLLMMIPLHAAAEGPRDEEIDALREMVQALKDQNLELRDQMDRMESRLENAQEEARAARDMAEERPLPSVATAPPYATPSDGALWSRRVGRANLQLLDLSLSALAAAGWSNANDEELEFLQGGGHDPNQRGFTLQQVEISLLGAVDPYFTGEAHLIYFLDAEGESKFEIEEAFATTSRLPFGLEEYGLVLELGHFFTEFGRHNPRHPHEWDWQDQPIVATRFFGGDGARAPGFRAGWLTPLPWFSEVHIGLQNAKGETMPSFLANDEVFEERPIAGRPFASSGVRGSDDLVHLARWVNGFDLGDEWSSQFGVSALFGPNATGNDASTRIFGADFVAKWQPLRTDRGWPFVTIEAEWMMRRYRADDFFGCPEEEEGECEDPADAIFLEDDVFRDWGAWAQVLWGFRRGWSAGVRAEYASGQGSGFSAEEGGFVDRDTDPFRSQRYRISPLLVFQPSEYSRLRLQYNYDRDEAFESSVAHSLWAGLEFSFGAHAAHAY